MNTFLIVDDNAINRMIIKKIVNRISTDVMEVSSGEEALQAVQMTNFDVVLMDLFMPGMSGIETALEISKLDNAPTMIAITADDQEEVKELDTSMFAGVLFKPFTEKHIISLLSKEQFDEQAFEQFLVDASLRKDIIGTFIAEEQNDTKMLVEAYESKDLEKIYKAVHYMKGSFSYIKANSLFDFSKQILDFCKSNDEEQVIQSQQQFMDDYHKLLDELRVYFKKIISK